MSDTQTTTTTTLEPATTDSEKASITGGEAAFDETARSSGSLESNASSSLSSGTTSSSSSTSTSQSLPSLVTSSTTLASAPISPGSSKAPSPCPSILRSNSAPPQSFPTSASFTSASASASASSSPNVTFAPLPQIEPRKRNSSHPLGIAARSRLLRHRRMLRERGLVPDDQCQYQYGISSEDGLDDDDDFPGLDDDDGIDGDGEEVVRRPRPRPRRSRSASEGDDEERDPLVALGKFMKGAGKTLWKSLSMREMRAKERAAAAAAETAKKADGSGQQGQEQGGEQGGERPKEEPRTRGTSQKKQPAPPRRVRMGTGHLFDDDHEERQGSGEGGVWEEEISEESLKKLLAHPPPIPDKDKDAVPVPRTSVDSTRIRRSKVTAEPSKAKVR